MKESLLKRIKREFHLKKEQRLRNQLNFLYKEVYKYYYDIQNIRGSSLDVPEFIQTSRRGMAERKAIKELLFRVADSKTVEKLCAKRMNQIRRERQFV